MSKLFGLYNFYLILPKETPQLSKIANVLYIPEPDYSNLIKQNYSLTLKNNNFIDLQYLNNKIKNYDYIKDLIHRSNLFPEDSYTYGFFTMSVTVIF